MSKREKPGRPTVFTQKLANKICQRIAEGDSVRTIVKDDDMPSSSTIFRWLLDESHKPFWEQYEKARNIQAELMFEELIDIADDGSNDWVIREGKDGEEWWQQNGEALGRSRLRVDTRKWYLSKIVPKKYGDKTILSNDPDNPFLTSANEKEKIQTKNSLLDNLFGKKAK